MSIAVSTRFFLFTAFALVACAPSAIAQADPNFQSRVDQFKFDPPIPAPSLRSQNAGVESGQALKTPVQKRRVKKSKHAAD